jgi:N-acetylglucosaminyl-diphospho-decaprenol L-rhamnosyltransferase
MRKVAARRHPPSHLQYGRLDRVESAAYFVAPRPSRPRDPSSAVLLMRVSILVLNYNGRSLLEACLPSVLRAAAASRHRCRTVVIDNASTDDSLAFLAARFSQVSVLRLPNQGLCSFNLALSKLDEPVALLLNNDIKLEEGCIDPLVAPFLDDHECFMTAPLCWRFDGRTYEGQKTAVAWRWGLVQATSLFPGHERGIRQPGLTASAGAALAVDRSKFLSLGGFDPLYLPGRLEDLDLSYRGYLAGYHARHVPEAVAYHLGQATFGPVFGADGCDALALRNTLLFQWKNLRRPAHLARQAIGLPLRLLGDAARAVTVPAARRWAFWRALASAWRQWQTHQEPRYRPVKGLKREREFFRRFHPAEINRGPELDTYPALQDTAHGSVKRIARRELVGSLNHP